MHRIPSPSHNLTRSLASSRILSPITCTSSLHRHSRRHGVTETASAILASKWALGAIASTLAGATYYWMTNEDDDEVDPNSTHDKHTGESRSSDIDPKLLGAKAGQEQRYTNIYNMQRPRFNVNESPFLKFREFYKFLEGANRNNPEEERLDGNNGFYEAVRRDIAFLVKEEPDFGRQLIRLGFRSAVTYSIHDGLGGCNGATMRFDMELGYPPNWGLDAVIRTLMELKLVVYGDKISHSDLWVLSSYVAIEHFGGNRIPFSPGRKDAPDASWCPSHLRTPSHIIEHLGCYPQDISDRLGINDKELSALFGAHSIGTLHEENSKVNGKWCENNNILSNDYYNNFVTIPYVYDKKTRSAFDPYRPEIKKIWTEYFFEGGARWKKWCEYYAYVDREVWLEDFCEAFKKVTELGLPVREVEVEE